MKTKRKKLPQKANLAKYGITQHCRIVKVANDEVNPITNQDPNPETIIESNKKYRSPIFCVVGHVDAGKTNLLSSIQGQKYEQEAGGITQQMKAYSIDYVRCKELIIAKKGYNIDIPNLLMIDTPDYS